MAAKPDLIVDIGSTSPTYVSLAERVQQTTGIPYLLFDGTLRDTPRLLRELGRAIGASAAGESLAADIEASLARIAMRIATIPLDRRPKVFYARGPNGLDCAARIAAGRGVRVAGARNVAEPPPGFAANLFSVDRAGAARQPDVIVTLDPVSRLPCARGSSDKPSPPTLKRTARSVRCGTVSTVPRRVTARPAKCANGSVSSGLCGSCIRKRFPNRWGRVSSNSTGASTITLQPTRK
jgi:iron complex transport system substrate-binding protein